MSLIIKNIDELFEKSGVKYKIIYENEKLNQAINYFEFLNEMESEIIQNNPSIDLISLLYSKYYWYTKFMKIHEYQYGEDMGIKQKQFKLLEELDQQVNDGVDFNIIRRIEEQNM